MKFCNEITSPKVRTIKTVIEDGLVQIYAMVLTECVVLISDCALLRSVLVVVLCSTPTEVLSD